jgi:hypothetical protein
VSSSLRTFWKGRRPLLGTTIFLVQKGESNYFGTIMQLNPGVLVDVEWPRETPDRLASESGLEYCASHLIQCKIT